MGLARVPRTALFRTGQGKRGWQRSRAADHLFQVKRSWSRLHICRWGDVSDNHSTMKTQCINTGMAGIIYGTQKQIKEVGSKSSSG
jgi:hypothetical protein